MGAFIKRNLQFFSLSYLLSWVFKVSAKERGKKVQKMKQLWRLLKSGDWRAYLSRVPGSQSISLCRCRLSQHSEHLIQTGPLHISIPNLLSYKDVLREKNICFTQVPGTSQPIIYKLITYIKRTIIYSRKN